VKRSRAAYIGGGIAYFVLSLGFGYLGFIHDSADWYWISVSIIYGFVSGIYLQIGITYEHRRRARDYRSAYSGTSTGTLTSSNITSSGSALFTYSPFTVRAFSTSTGVSKELTAWYGGPVQDREEGMKTKEQSEPVKAWKVANIYFHDDGRVRFTPLVQNMVYEPEGYAKCAFVEEVYNRLDVVKLESEGWTVTNDHGQVPSEQCTCGFYAMTDMLEATGVEPIPWTRVAEAGYPELTGMTYAGTGLLEVEFFGRIIRAKRGYRAEYQRVICVYTYPPEGMDENYPKPPVQVDWKWITTPYPSVEQPF
jgi:hypothetical protein